MLGEGGGGFASDREVDRCMNGWESVHGVQPDDARGCWPRSPTNSYNDSRLAHEHHQTGHQFDMK